MKKYAVYKESGIEWLGAIPDHWETSRIKTVSRVNPTKDESIDKASEELVTFLPMECVNVNGTIVTEQKKTIKNLYSGFTFFRKGDIIFAKITPCFENGKGAFLSNLDTSFGFGSTEFHVLRPNEDQCNPEFLYFFTCSQIFRTVGEAFMTGAAGQKRVPSDFVQNFQISLPPIKEQKIIAKYISHKLIRIDSLINKKQQMIELLKEERAAIINQAVTKGINPDAEMKDSGIEWLGEVPKHWEIKKLKYFVGAILGGGTPSKNTPEYWIGEIPWVSPKDMKSDLISDSIDKISHKAISESSTSLIPKNSVLIVVRSGILKHTIPVALNTVEVTLNQDMKAVIPKKCLKSEYLFFIIKGMQNELLTFTTKIGATVDSIEYEYLINFSITLPPLQEQERILSYIQKETHKIDNLISLAEREIMLFEEYRTALINEAVTGKIDIRTNNEANHV